MKKLSDHQIFSELADPKKFAPTKIRALAIDLQTKLEAEEEQAPDEIASNYDDHGAAAAQEQEE